MAARQHEIKMFKRKQKEELFERNMMEIALSEKTLVLYHDRLYEIYVSNGKRRERTHELPKLPPKYVVEETKICECGIRYKVGITERAKYYGGGNNNKSPIQHGYCVLKFCDTNYPVFPYQSLYYQHHRSRRQPSRSAWS